MQVSPEARQFSDIHELEEIEAMREKFQKLCEERKIVDGPTQVATVTGSRETLKALQDDLRKAGYRKLR